MANTYSNPSLQIHEVASSPYNQAPDMYLNITTGVTVRSGDTIKITIESASLNELSGLSYFGYTIAVYASIDDGTLVQLFSKPASPNQWSSGIYQLASPVEISSTNLTTSTVLKIWFESTCDCNSGNKAVVQSIQLDAPARTYTVTFNPNGGTLVSGTLVQSVAISGSATPPTVSREGYNFISWSGDYTNVTSDRTITANWSEAAYIWKFHDGAWHKELRAKRYSNGAWGNLSGAKKCVGNDWVDI